MPGLVDGRSAEPFGERAGEDRRVRIEADVTVEVAGQGSADPVGQVDRPPAGIGLRCRGDPTGACAATGSPPTYSGRPPERRRPRPVPAPASSSGSPLPPPSPPPAAPRSTSPPPWWPDRRPSPSRCPPGRPSGRCGFRRRCPPATLSCRSPRRDHRSRSRSPGWPAPARPPPSATATDQPDHHGEAGPGDRHPGIVRRRLPQPRDHVADPCWSRHRHRRLLRPRHPQPSRRRLPVGHPRLRRIRRVSLPLRPDGPVRRTTPDEGHRVSPPGPQEVRVSSLITLRADRHNAQQERLQDQTRLAGPGASVPSFRRPLQRSTTRIDMRCRPSRSTGPGHDGS